MNSSTRSLLGVLLILVITFCTTFVVSRVMASFGGFDLTEAKLYTLNEGTLSIIDKLPQPLTIKLFYSKEGVNKTGSDGPLLDFNNYYYYVRDLLRAYQRHGGVRWPPTAAIRYADSHRRLDGSQNPSARAPVAFLAATRLRRTVAKHPGIIRAARIIHEQLNP